jgi:phospholipid-transporting ATPase
MSAAKFNTNTTDIEQVNISTNFDEEQSSTPRGVRFAESSFNNPNDSTINSGYASMATTVMPPPMSIVPQQRFIKVNHQLQQIKHCSNSISTSKYNAFTFLPKFLFEQFQKYSNVFFFIIVMLQQIPDVSPTGRFTTLVPLVFILGVSALKEIVEDFKRRNSDRQLNNKRVSVFRSNDLVTPQWVTLRWKDLCVGDIVKVSTGEQFPADLLLISSSEPNAICYICTSNLDGETNLKIRQAHMKTSKLLDSVHLKQLNAEIECEMPNQRLYEFSG